MSICRKCHRVLKREPWRSKGIGKICSAKEHVDSVRASQDTGDTIVPYDGGDIFMERIAAPTYEYNGQIGLIKHSASGVRTNVQRIEVKHSPSGFNFGYGGSGPADMALNIMLMFTDKETAHTIYQDFKWKYLAGEGDKIVLPKSIIVGFIEEQKVFIKQIASK